MPVIHVIGMGADGLAGLRPELAKLIQSADFLAGGERHLRLAHSANGQSFVIKDNLGDLLGELSRRHSEQKCVVLGSGDPLFYGVGSLIAGTLGWQNVRIEPAVSSMQLAFARAGLSWQHAHLATIHGRDLRTHLLPLLGRHLIGLFTQDGDSPSAVARFFLQFELNDYAALVGENLGAVNERITRWENLQELTQQRFAPLNYLILQRTDMAPSEEIDRRRGLVPGVPDEAFARPSEGREVMTRQEVRSVLLGKIGPTQAGDVIWDIGAGLGTVSVELAVLRNNVEVVAVERDPSRVGYLRQNRDRFDAYNIRIVEGTAPAVLAEEKERPKVVFLGGSGDQLEEILDFVHAKLQPGGRLLANFVTLENLLEFVQKLKAWQWRFDVTEIHIARSDDLAGLTGLKPHRGVFLVGADKPESSDE
jgi:precorrin-6B C5,15-methyltransferase / cobalt-precorrin-6B C5,C15-methyltransferase